MSLSCVSTRVMRVGVYFGASADGDGIHGLRLRVSSGSIRLPRYTGFRNGLSLNADLADANPWTADQMRERRRRLAGQAFDLFRLDGRPSR